ncbi:MAG: hypothetical protein ACOY9Y_10610 [Bacillota bacterium]
MTKRSPTLPEPHAVNTAGIWDESVRSYPGNLAVIAHRTRP